MKYILLIFTIAIVLSSCGNDIKPLERFDAQAWKTDKCGCNGKRASLYNAILTQQKDLMNHSQEEVKAYFGMPDKNELLERGQKQFIYFFQNGVDCKNKSGVSQAIYLRFSALNNLYEVSVQ